MSELRAHLADYIALRRGLGFVCKEGDSLLPSFVGFLEARAAPHLTTELAVAWATSSPGVLAVTKRQRLVAVRGFAEYLRTRDGQTEVPPAALLPANYSRVAPYIYSDADIDALMAAARTLTPALRARTYETFIGLLAVSGLRMGEAIRLDRSDIDLSRSLLVVRNSKLEKARQVPLHPSAIAALVAYATERDGHFGQSSSDSLFVSINGTRLYPRTVEATYRQLVTTAGLAGRGQRTRPRLHDLRHSFAVKTLIDWYRDGTDVDASMPLLSKTLGHVSPASTYWYLQAVPELFAIIAKRVEGVFEDLP
jgi:integrase/recombinase XerD